MCQANKDIREMLKACHVKNWELAKALGISSSWFSVRMRSELPDDEKIKIFGIIQQIADEREVEA